MISWIRPIQEGFKSNPGPHLSEGCVTLIGCRGSRDVGARDLAFDSERSMPIQRGKELRRRRTRRKKVARLRQRYAVARSEVERAAILEKLSKVAPGLTL